MGDRQDGTEPMSAEVAVMVLRSDTASPRLTMEAVGVIAELVNQRVPEFVDMPDDNGVPQCWHFVGYRPDAAALGKHTPDQLNPPDAPQYQGVIFADGTCVMRWLTARRSWSVWGSFGEMFDVHGHPEYGTRIAWPNGVPQEAAEVISNAQRALEEKRAAEAEAAELEAAPDLNVVAPAETNDARTLVERARAQHQAERLAIPESTPPSWSATELEPDNALVVCLDCTGWNGGPAEPMVVPFTERADADSWLRVHAEGNSDHRVVTVPGWPARSVAIATAQAHIASGMR
jgi:hypothetical protein